MLEDEKDDKEDELRLKKYEIDVKAEIELAKLAKDGGMSQEQIIALVNQVLMNAAQQPELPEDDETYQHEQQEVYNPMIEQQEAEQEIEQMPMMQDHDLNQLNLPDVIQNEVQ
jgi:CHAT domain-containing protein